MNYVKLYPGGLRKNYNTGRKPIKVSLSPAVWNELANAGALKTAENKRGVEVAARGNYASAFIERALETLLFLISTPESSPLREAMRDSFVELALDLTDNPETVLKNLRELAEQLASVEFSDKQ